MEQLEEVRKFKFKGYSKGGVESTLENINELIEDSEMIWKSWLEEGIDIFKVFEIDFEFYSSDNNGTIGFRDLLDENGYETKIDVKKMLLFMKGYKLKATLNDIWTLNKLKEKIELLGLLARKYNLLIEGYGAFSSQHRK